MSYKDLENPISDEEEFKTRTESKLQNSSYQSLKKRSQFQTFCNGFYIDALPERIRADTGTQI